MKVELMAHTPDPDMVVYKAARTCYQAGGIHDIKAPSGEVLEKFIAGLIKSGHTSTLEHAVFTFSIEGISRVVSHELVRHRIASYSQQSQRYVNYKDRFCIPYIPDDIQGDTQLREIFDQAWVSAVYAYDKLVEAGVKPQDARYILPNAMQTQLVCTFNARSLLNFFSLRCCRRAQPEMQELAYKMLYAVRTVAPVIFRDAGRQCATCTEERKCNEADR